MAAEMREPTLSGRARAAISPIAELEFLLFAIRRGGPEYEAEPLVQAFHAGHPDLVGRVREFWQESSRGEAGCGEWGELFVLADAADALLAADPAEFLGRIEAIAATPIPQPALESEEPETRATVARRLAELAASGERRAAYASLLRDCWAAMREPWESAGRERAESAALRVNAALRTAERLADVLPGTHIAVRERFDGLIRRELDRGRVTIVPSGLAMIGSSVYSLPSTLLVAFGYGQAQTAKHWREAGEQAANRLKVLADPTRMALLNRLLHASMSITDLARYFEISQPTVSVHVKLLREAGLLQSERAGQLTLYRAWPDQLKEYIEAATKILMEDANARPDA